MKLEDALQCLGIRDLRALTDAWGVDVVKRDDPAEYIDRVLANRQEILDQTAITRHLELADLPYRTHMLAKIALRELLNERGYTAPVDEFHASLIDQEKEFVEWAKKPTALRQLDPKVVDIYEAVLTAAWEDNVNASEFRLLERLRAKLGITRRDHRIMEIQLGKFPGTNETVHTASEIEEAVRELIRRGLVLRVSCAGQPKSYCIPEELAALLRSILEIELTAPAYLNLLNKLPVAALRSSLEKAGQPFSGTGPFLAARIVDGYVSPRAVLRELDDDQLGRLLKTLQTARQDGSREIKIRNVIKHFDHLTFADVPGADKRAETYISYYVELASRSYATLRAAAVISKDRDIEHHFEEATTALFRDYLGFAVEEFEGSDHPDGKVLLADKNRTILWDCKSCESGYGLTDRLARQFLSYATAAAPRVASPLLVIAPGFTPESTSTSVKVKTQCPPGTEIALIQAADMLWLARSWRQRRVKDGVGSLPWQVLAVTGDLTRQRLETQLKTFAP